MAEVKKSQSTVKKISAAKAAGAAAAKKPAAAKPAPKAETKKVEKAAPVKKPAVKKEAKKINLESGRNLRKTRIGIVTSNKMQKTIVVKVESRKNHPLYGKVVKSHKKYKAHDEENVAGIGDEVEIIETRPLSRDKHFRLLRVLKKAK